MRQQQPCTLVKSLDDLSSMREAPGPLQTHGSVCFGGAILSPQSQQIQHVVFLRTVGPHHVRDWVGELALSQVIEEAFLSSHLRRKISAGVGELKGVGAPLYLLIAHVLQIVQDLEDQTDHVDQFCDFDFHWTHGLQQSQDQSEQTSGLIKDHLQVVCFGRRLDCVPPDEFHALPSVEVHHLLVEDSHRFRPVREVEQVLLGFEVDVICRIDRLGDSEDFVRRRQAAAQLGAILDVVDPANVSNNRQWRGSRTYSKEALCIMVTVSAMMWLEASSTWNQWLKASMNCLRISFPGIDAT